MPPPGEPARVQFWRKTKWTITAIFFPEVALYTAWQQHSVAARFCKELERIRLQEEGLEFVPRLNWIQRSFKSVSARVARRSHRRKTSPAGVLPTSESGEQSHTGDPPAGARPPPFSLSYGFYVGMGGVVVDISDIYDTVTCITVTPAGLLDLARRTSWKNVVVDDATIRDKSKADYFAKLIVFVQVSYTIFQCVTRRVFGYPLTVLEVHVLAHATCALFMYGFWFRKPLDIRDPTRLDTRSWRDELALALMASQGSACVPFMLYQYPREFDEVNEFHPCVRSEAGHFVFDMEKINAALEEDRKDDITRTSICTIEGIVADGEEAGNQDLEDRIERAHRGAFIPQAHDETGPTRVKPSSILESGKLSYLPEEVQLVTAWPMVYRCRKRDIQPVVVLITGETLPCGIGPAAWGTSRVLKPKRGFRNYIDTRILRRKKGHSRNMVLAGLVKNPLRDLLCEAEYPSSKPQSKAYMPFHAMTVWASERDLVRWRRAARAFARMLLNWKCPLGDSQPADTMETESDASPDGQSRSAGTQQALDQSSIGGSGDSSSRKPRIRSLEWVPWKRQRKFFQQQEFTLRARNMQFEFWNRGIPYLIVIILIGSVYAGIHLTLWNYDFPTNSEKLLWRISCLALGVPLSIWPL